jgi:CheY-like chemotaxis protein
MTALLAKLERAAQSADPATHALIEDARAAVERIRAVVEHMEAPRDENAPPSPRARILIVEDDPLLGMSLARMLRSYDVVLLEDAEAALAKLREGERFDFILCDVVMPRMNGLRFVDGVAALDPELARSVVFMSGGAPDRAIREELAATPNVVLEKPFKTEAIRELLRQRRRR